MKKIFALCLILLGLSSCVELYEEDYIERIKRPEIDIKVTPPTWDSIPPNNNNVDFEIKK